MFCGRRYAAYVCINAVYIRTLNGVHSTGKKTPILCVCTAECECIFEGAPVENKGEWVEGSEKFMLAFLQ
jgi:hypothetical protein